MSDLQRVIRKTVPLDGMLFSDNLPGLTYQGEQNAHRFIITCVRGGSAVPLTGSTIMYYFLCADGTTVSNTGSVDSDGAAVVTLAGDCYNAMGRAEITITATLSEDTIVIYHAVTSVTRTRSTTIIDGGDIVDLPAIQAEYDNMVAAVANANGAVTYIAPTETSPAASAHAAGEYIIYNGTLYEVIAPIAANDALTVGTNIAAVTNGVSGQVGELKGAFDYTDARTVSNFEGGVYYVGFVNGNLARTASELDYYITRTIGNTYCSIDPGKPLMINAGDTIVVDSNYKIKTCYRIETDISGAKWVKSYADAVDQANYTFMESGLYVIAVRKPSTGSSYASITYSDLVGKVYVITNGIIKGVRDSIAYTNNRLMETRPGWCYHAKFINGSANITNKHYVYAFTGTTCITPEDCPIIASKGDSIDITDSSYVITGCGRVIKDNIGLKVCRTITKAIGAQHYTFEESGLYVVLIRKPVPDSSPVSYSNISYLELEGKVKITANGSVFNVPQKPANPYANLDWSGTQYITSCHAHCPDTVAGLIGAGYTALIPTNYRPSKPYYPLNAFYPNVEGIENYLSAPNSEVAGSIPLYGTATKAAHFSPLGSFFSLGTSTSSAYSGLFDQFITDCRNTRKGWFMGGVIINHPTLSGLSADDMYDVLLRYSDILGIEIYNYGAEVSDSKGYAITQWDALLSTGLQCFGFAAPDHAIQSGAEANMPYGFIHVLPSCPTDDALLAAIGSGKFYASLYNDGLKFTKIALASSTLTVTASAETQDNPNIRFITATRDQTETGLSASFSVTPSDIYVRVEVSNGSNKLYSNAIML